MPVLAILIEIAALILILFRVKNNFQKALAKLSLVNQEKNTLLDTLEERIKFTQEANQKLARTLDLEYDLFEINQELSGCIEEEDIRNTFLEKIKAIFKIPECAFMDKAQIPGISAEYSIFTVVAGEHKTLHLAVKNPSGLNRAKMLTLINQLQLSLKRYNLYSEIQRLSTTDSLTGMYVRRYFLERFKQELLRSQQNEFSLSLLLIDVDNFKTYNDTYGHLSGDAILKEIAGIIKGSSRQIDLPARYGGEEFCIMLPETNKEGAFLAAERIRLAAQEAEIKVFNANLKISLSIGISSYPGDARESDLLIDKADTALYKAKASGRNRVCAWGID